MKLRNLRCKRCGGNYSGYQVNHHLYCADCRVARGKERKARYSEKTKARSKVAIAVRAGKLVRQPCEICREPNAQAHHEDYSRPFDVRWLCQSHHLWWHDEKSEAPIDSWISQMRMGAA